MTNPLSMTVEQAAKMATEAGPGEVTAEMIEDDIDAGLPTNPDGTINIVVYVAWLIQESTN